MHIRKCINIYSKLFSTKYKIPRIVGSKQSILISFHVSPKSHELFVVMCDSWNTSLASV